MGGKSFFDMTIREIVDFCAEQRSNCCSCEHVSECAKIMIGFPELYPDLFEDYYKDELQKEGAEDGEV